MGKVIRASVLVLLLAGSAHAGWGQNDSPVPAPTPAPASAIGSIQNESLAPAELGGRPDANVCLRNGAADALTEAALFVLNGLLALL